MAHVTVHFNQEPMLPYPRDQQEWYEVCVRFFFQKCFGVFASFIVGDADLWPSSKNEIILWHFLKTSRTSMIIFIIDNLVYNLVNVYFC
jgi:hypothetical protein